jgi:tRNA(Ile)-lysidine synthase
MTAAKPPGAVRRKKTRQIKNQERASGSTEPECSLAARFARALEELGSPLNAPFALAVSGGGDSIALMHLAADWLKANAIPFDRGTVLTVDHGLRPGSAREAAATAAWAKSVGFKSHTLAWRGPKPHANIEDAARNARYRLIGDWARAHGVTAVLLAHTRDDQAETFLLRLGRGSGVDGLSAMRAKAPFPLPGYDTVALLRPLLDIGRAELRADLAARQASFIEDPMNADTRFARIRIRTALMPALEAAGISSTRIAHAAAHLGRARAALESATEQFLARHARFDPVTGRAVLDGAALRAQPREIGLRALSLILNRVSGRPYRPRFDRLENVFDALPRSPGLTLSGCRIGPAPRDFRHFGAATLAITREAPRRATGPRKKHAQESPITGGKLPKKRRIIPRLSGS